MEDEDNEKKGRGRKQIGNVVSFPADFSSSVGKSMFGNPPIPFRFTVFQSLLASYNHCLHHVVHCTSRTLTAMQSYVTSHKIIQYANILADLTIGELPDVLFPTEGEKSAGNERKDIVGQLKNTIRHRLRVRSKSNSSLISNRVL